MTHQIIERWSKIRNLSLTDAMLELRFLGDILASNKKAPTPMEAHEMICDETILPQIEYDENQLSLTHEGGHLTCLNSMNCQTT